jgi:hypothetical protein
MAGWTVLALAQRVGLGMAVLAGSEPGNPEEPAFVRRAKGHSSGAVHYLDLVDFAAHARLKGQTKDKGPSMQQSGFSGGSNFLFLSNGRSFSSCS